MATASDLLRACRHVPVRIKTAAAVLVIVSFILSIYADEFTARLQGLAQFVNALSLSIVASFIFYVVVVKWKDEEDKRKAFEATLPFLKSIEGACEDVIKKITRVPTDEHCLDGYTEDDITKAIDESTSAQSLYDPVYGSPLELLGMENTWKNYLVWRFRGLRKEMRNIYSKSFLLDTEFNKRLFDIESCNMFQTVEVAFLDQDLSDQLDFVMTQMRFQSKELFRRAQRLREYRKAWCNEYGLPV